MSEKRWHEFINYSPVIFREKAYGRYYVISSTPVRSIHNAGRNQVTYRRWRAGDSYPTLNVPKSDIIITRSMGKEPVITTVAEQVNVAEAYEATIVTPRGGVIRKDVVGKVGGIAKLPLVLVAIAIAVLGYFLFGRQRG